MAVLDGSVGRNPLYGDGWVYNSTLPNGKAFVTAVTYTSKEARGVIALLVVSAMSLVAVTGLLVAIGKLCVDHSSCSQGVFAFPVGSIMSAKWVAGQLVQYNTYCVVQGVIKQIADVGTATWSLAIALHTFNVLFLKLTIPRYALFVTLLTGWGFIAAIVCIGPTAFDPSRNGPFFGISGMWCWISSGYATQRIALDYMEMFMSAFLCAILYTLVFLRIRGNIHCYGSRWSFHLKARNRDSIDQRELFGHTVARRMIFFPVAYTALLLPIAIARFLEWSRVDIASEALLFCDAIFLLSGVVNVSMFWVTRSLLPRKAVVVVSRPALVNTVPRSLPLSVFVNLSTLQSVDDKISV